jgi:glycosyltransferase involved in cell wall biosynthesis
MHPPRTSIITRTRDRPAFLRRAAQSICGQETSHPFEWIVVNDAGDPKEVESVLAQADLPGDCLQLINLTESKGMEHASNKGLESARGDFIAIHDDDDSWDPHFLEKTLAWLDAPENQAAAGVVTRVTRIVEEWDGKQLREQFRHPFNPELSQISFWDTLKLNRFPPIAFIYRQKLLAGIGLYNEALPVLGDWEFNLRVLARYAVGLLDEPLACYHHRTANSAGKASNSVTGGDQLHRETEDRLRSQWQRSNPFGIDPEVFAVAAGLTGHLHQMETGLQRLLDQTQQLPERPSAQS